MSRTEAQVAASRSNGLKSKGPKTDHSKSISRRNALKHGMAALTLLPQDDLAEVDRRTAAMLEEMGATCEMGDYYVRRLARVTVRVERCASHELAAIAHLADHAPAAFDEARIAEVDDAVARLGTAPATLSRKLRSMPEGLDRMIAELLELLVELEAGRWSVRHGERVAYFRGHSGSCVPATREAALTEAIAGRFEDLRPEDGAWLSREDRMLWAQCELIQLIDDEMEMLLGHHQKLDRVAIEVDRMTAASRSSFDATKQAELARRYEAAAVREVDRSLKELRRVEDEAATRAAEAEPAPVEDKVEDEAEEKVEAAPSGSFGGGPGSSPAQPETQAPVPGPGAVEPMIEGAKTPDKAA